MAYVPSYARPRPHRLFGLGSYQDLPPVDPNAFKQGDSFKAQAKAAASAIGDQGKAQAIAFAQQQLQNYPSAAAVAAEFGQYASYLKDVPGFNLDDLKDPEKCVGLMKQALMNYARDNGVPMSTPEVEKQIEEYALHAAASELLGFDIPPSWPSNLKDFKSVAIDLATTAVVMETGIDPKVITVTANALADGKLSPAECEAIGGVAGSIAGATLAQSFGIPAPIGAFIGGLIGKDIGGTFAQIFGAGQSGAEEVQSRIDKMRDWENTVLSEAQRICSTTRSIYWQTFDNLLLATELQWETAEVQIGWKFGLRWFGTETYTSKGQAFSHAWDQSRGAFVGPEVSTSRAYHLKCQDIVTYPSTGAPVHSSECSYYCAYEYGCPYPTVPNLPAPANLSRDVQAFLARGALWIPPEQRKYQCSFQFPPVATNFGALTADWAASVQADLQREQVALQALQILSVTVVGDLIKTAASNAAEKKINDILRQNSFALNQSALARASALRKAQATGKNLSNFLNYGMLFVGAGLLGAALWKKHGSAP